MISFNVLLMPLISAVVFLKGSSAFLSTRHSKISLSNALPTSSFHVLRASVEKDVEDEQENPAVEPLLDEFPDAAFLTFTMANHRPLGCTVEESLDPNDNYVFISKIVPDGNAEKAGIQVGDVIAGVTGLFRELTPALNLWVDKMLVDETAIC